MIEGAVGPGDGIVAGLAGRRESGVWNRSRRVVVVVLVATDAGGIGDVVVIIDVTIRALAGWNGVRSGEREAGFRVIKRGRFPGCCVVTSVAGLREALLRVVWIIRVLVIRQMAGHAGRTRQVVVIVDMAIGALPRRDSMSAGKREIHHRVIERCRRPGRCAVALSAIGWEISGRVIGICGPLKILQMAADAGGAGEVVVVVGVAVGALSRWNGVRAGQGKSGGIVIKSGVEPVVGAVAGVAGGRELG